MESISLFLVFSLLLLWVMECSADICLSSSSYSYEWCDHGCCSDGCCSDGCCSGLAGWIIALIVIGIIIAVVIIAVIICVLTNKKGQAGRVVHPNFQPNVTVIRTAPGGAYGPPPAYNTVHPPPGSALYNHGNAGYSNPAFSDPAYPPGFSGGNPPPQSDPFAAAAAGK